MHTFTSTFLIGNYFYVLFLWRPIIFSNNINKQLLRYHFYNEVNKILSDSKRNNKSLETLYIVIVPKGSKYFDVFESWSLTRLSDGSHLHISFCWSEFLCGCNKQGMEYVQKRMLVLSWYEVTWNLFLENECVKTFLLTH